MTNPFVAPNMSIRSTRPLCPWDDNEHESYYADVDNTFNAYCQFQNFFQEIDTNSSGHAVLVTGSSGCGKSSLIHRCVNFIRSEFKRCFEIEPIIIDLSNETQPSVAVETKFSTACELIVDRLSLIDDLLTPVEQARLSERAKEPIKAIAYISELCVAKRKCLAIILPTVELDQEFRAYLSLLRKQIFLFLESSYTEVRKFCERHHGPATSKPIKVLMVGHLTTEDGWKFASHRLSVVDTKKVSIDEQSVKKFMEARIDGQGNTTIRELTVTFSVVFDHALKNGSNTITYSDFQEYYLRAGFVG